MKEQKPTRPLLTPEQDHNVRTYIEKCTRDNRARMKRKRKKKAKPPETPLPHLTWRIPENATVRFPFPLVYEV